MWAGNLKTAIANLRANRWRSLLTMMGIIIGITSVVTVVSLGEGLKNQVVGQIGQLGSDVLTVRSGKLVQGRTGGLNLLSLLNTSTLTEKDVAAIKKMPSVAEAIPVDFVTNSAQGDSGESDNAFVLGTTPGLPDVLRQKLNFGGFFTPDNEAQNVAIIGSGIAEQLFGETNPIGHSLQISGQSFTVYGVLKASSGGLLSIAQTDFNSAIFIPLGPAKNLTNDHTNILQILVRSKNADNLDATVNDVRNALFKTHGGQDNFSVLKQYELLSILSSVINTVTGFISGIAAISLLVGGIGIMDIMLVSVTERTREIGIRKAIGATNRQILSQFLTEGLVLTIAGGAIGIIISLLINLILRLYTGWHPVIKPWVIILAAGVSITIGIIFSVVPALKAARKNPIDALRGD